MGELQQQTDRERVGMHFGEGRQVRRADLMRVAARPVNADHSAELFRLGIDRIVKCAAQRHGQPHRQDFKAFQSQLGHAATQLLGRGLRIAQRQHADATHPIGQRVKFFGEVCIAGARNGECKIQLLDFRHISRPGGKTNRMNHPLSLHHRVPFVDLLLRAEILPAHRHFKTIE